MKKHCVRILSAFFGLAALAAAAHGQVPDQLTVRIPYEFVVAGKTLPAGTYRVNRANDRDEGALVISSFENRVALLVLSSEVADRTRAGLSGHLTFQQVGDQHLLSKIETGEHVFTIRTSAPAVLESAVKDHSNPSVAASGNSGNN